MAPALGTRETVAVLGAGSWGTALAILLSRDGDPARLWGHNPEQMARLAADGRNARYLPDAPFPPSLALHDDLDGALEGVRTVLVVVPSHAFRTTLEALAPRLPAGARVAWATKGLEPDSHKLLHEVAAEALGPRVPQAVLSGPTFAREVAAGLPTAITVASSDEAYADALAERVRDDRFRAYTSQDVVGVEVGGAVKNVLAIAAGIADGLGLGANTRSALITRGLAEIMRLGEALGASRDTFMGLAGLGDLVLTCTDDQSRNRRLGLALGRGEGLNAARGGIDQVVEGMETARVVRGIARRLGVEMPISEQVHQVVHEGQDPRAAVAELLHRRQKPETG